MGGHDSMTISEKNPGSPRRSFWVKLLSFGLLVFSFFGWLRFVLSIIQWDWLLSVGVHPGPWYTAVSGLIWALLGTTSLLLVWFGRSKSPNVTLITVFLYSIWYWLDRLLLNASESPQANTVFVVGTMAVCIGLVFIVFYKERNYFSH
jgi:hypothetical protein